MGGFISGQIFEAAKHQWQPKLVRQASQLLIQDLLGFSNRQLRQWVGDFLVGGTFLMFVPSRRGNLCLLGDAIRNAMEPTTQGFARMQRGSFLPEQYKGSLEGVLGVVLVV